MARKQSPRRRSAISANGIVRGVAALAGAAILLKEPVESGYNGFTGNGGADNMQQSIPQAANYAIKALKDQGAGTYIAAFAPSMAAEVGIQVKNLVGKAGRGLGRWVGG